MPSPTYALGSTARAARRLEIQDRQHAEISEGLLDALDIRPEDRVLELGIGAGSFTRRVLRRLGPQGVLIGVDYTQDLLDQAAANLAGAFSGKLEFVLSDARDVGRLAGEADVVIGRTVLHHLAIPETFLGELRHSLRPRARLGFIEPEFRALLGRLAHLEAAGRSELAPLRRWAEGISRYYQMSGLAPTIGASLAATFEAAGYRDVRDRFWQCPTDAAAIENMTLYYDEIREKYVGRGVMTADEIDRDQRLLAALPTTDLPPIWGMHSVTCVA